MLVYLVLDALLRGAGAWSVINLFASNSYGPAALGRAFHPTTVAGLAWQLGFSGILGLAMSPALERRPFRCAIVGAIVAVAWYYGVVRWLWPHWNPLAARHQPFPGLLLGYLIFGLLMGNYPRLLAELAEPEASLDGSPKPIALP